MISFVKVNWLLIRMVLMVIGGVIGYMVGFELYVVFIYLVWYLEIYFEWNWENCLE